MKKTGFTLAEVLITLAIIGVVATMTLPALMTNTNEQQSKTGLKKVINTLTVGAEMNSAKNGFNYSSITAASTSNDKEESLSLLGLLRATTNVDEKNTKPMLTATASYPHKGASNYVVYFRDGSSVEFPTAAPAQGKITDGIKAVVDINGKKNPNILSNCKGTVTQYAASQTDGIASGKTCSDKAYRIIRDKFSVKLIDEHVEPNGHAARWAFDN